MIESRKIEDLDPAVQQIARRHVVICRERGGFELLITSTWRDAESQDRIFAVGRTIDIEHPRVTDARGWMSWHQYKCAWDVVPLVGGKCVWKTSDPKWKITIEAGIEAGAARGPAWDFPHFQVVPVHNGKPMALDVARALFKQNGSIFRELKA